MGERQRQLAARGTLKFEPTLNTNFLFNLHGAPPRDELSRLGQSYGTGDFVCLVPGKICSGPVAVPPDQLTTRTAGVLAGPQDNNPNNYLQNYIPIEVRERLRAGPLLRLDQQHRRPVPPNRVEPPRGRRRHAEGRRRAPEEPGLRALGGRLQPHRPDAERHLRRLPPRRDRPALGRPAHHQFWLRLLRPRDRLRSRPVADGAVRGRQQRFLLADLPGRELLARDVQRKLSRHDRLCGYACARPEPTVNLLSHCAELALHAPTPRMCGAPADLLLLFDFWTDFKLDGAPVPLGPQTFVCSRRPLDAVFTSGYLGFAHRTLRGTYRFRDDTHAYWKYTPAGSRAATTPRRPRSRADDCRPAKIDAFGPACAAPARRRIVLYTSFFSTSTRLNLHGPQFLAAPRFVIRTPRRGVYGTGSMYRPAVDGAFLQVRFSWLESQFLDFVKVDQFLAQGAGDSSVLFREQQNSGNPLLNSPKYKVSLTAEQTVPLFNVGFASLRYDAAWSDTTYYADQGARPGRFHGRQVPAEEHDRAAALLDPQPAALVALARRAHRDRRLGAQPGEPAGQDVRRRRQHVPPHHDLLHQRAAHVRRQHHGHLLTRARVRGSRSRARAGDRAPSR